MQKEIEIKNRKISYTLRKSRQTKCLRLSIHPGGVLKISAPRFFPVFRIENFILEKADWILEKIKKMEKHSPNFFPEPKNDLEYQRMKRKAYLIAYERLKHFNVHYGFQYKKISIRNQKTRWGSCSARGTLSFSCKIAALPEKLSDYIIVHELCHLEEFNHSERFWRLVSKTMPDFRKIRRELREKYS